MLTTKDTYTTETGDKINDSRLTSAAVITTMKTKRSFNHHTIQGARAVVIVAPDRPPDAPR